MTARTPQDMPGLGMAVRLLMAPLMGLTQSLYRRLFARHFPGFTGAMAPFVTVTTAGIATPGRLRDLAPAPGALPLEPQLMSADGVDMAKVANWLHAEWGYPVVNWNIGCPAGSVTGHARGAGILEHPSLVDRYLERACNALVPRLSVKMRLGMRNPDDFLDIIPVLNRYPLTEVTIHPRTGVQRYGGTVDLERFGQALSQLRHPVVYNGDITTAQHARDIQARFPGLAGLMVGRGAVACPWLPQAIQDGADAAARVSLPQLGAFHDDLLEGYRQQMEGGIPPVLDKMKEVWKHWEALCVGGHKALKRVLKARRLDAYLAAAEAALGRAEPAADADEDAA